LDGVHGEDYERLRDYLLGMPATTEIQWRIRFENSNYHQMIS